MQVKCWRSVAAERPAAGRWAFIHAGALVALLLIACDADQASSREPSSGGVHDVRVGDDARPDDSEMGAPSPNTSADGVGAGPSDSAGRSDSPCALPTAEDADNVREAAFRRLMADEYLGSVVIFFLGISHGDGIDLDARGAAPSTAFMARFAGESPLVKSEPWARYDESTGAVSDPDGLGPGAVLHVGTIHWLSIDSAQIDGSWYLADLVAEGFRVILRREHDGTWSVVEIRGIWVS